MGSRRSYDFVHDSPQVELHPVDYTNDTAVIRQNYRVLAIDSALELIRFAHPAFRDDFEASARERRPL